MSRSQFLPAEMQIYTVGWGYMENFSAALPAVTPGDWFFTGKSAFFSCPRVYINKFFAALPGPRVYMKKSFAALP